MKKVLEVAGVMIVNQKGETLLFKRNKIDPEDGSWGPLGGKLKPGEGKKEALLREVFEEAAIKLDLKKLKYFKAYRWEREAFDIKFYLYTYRINTKEIKPVLDTREHTEYMWLNPKVAFNHKELMRGMYVILADFFGPLL